MAGTCPAYVGTGPGWTTYGGLGWFDGGSKLLTVGFSAGYHLTWWNFPALTVHSTYNADAFPGGGQFDYVEVDDAGRAFSWAHDSGELRRFVASGSAYVLDAVLRTGEPGYHMSAFNHYDGKLWYAWGANGLASSGSVYRLDPETGAVELGEPIAQRNAFHNRLACCPDGTVWRSEIPTDVGYLGLWRYQAHDGTNSVIASVLDAALRAYGDAMYGYFPWGDDGSCAVMIGPTVPDGDDHPLLVAPPAGGVVTPTDCTWRFDGADPAGTSYAPLFSGTGVARDGQVVMGVNFGLGSFAGLGEPGGNGIWLSGTAAATARGWVSVATVERT